MCSVEDEYRKNPELKKEDVERFLEWGKTQPHLPEISEMEAIQFLHSNYFDFEEAKKTAEHLYTYRTQYPELFSGCDATSDEMQQAHKTITLTVLPKTTPEGYRVIFTKLRDTDPASLDFIASLKLDILLMNCIITQEGTCNGYVLLYDMEGTSLGHIFKMSLFAMKHFLAYVQNAMPIRLKIVEHVNIPNFIDKLIGMCRPFMKKELMSILKYRKTVEEAYEAVPADLWPKDYPNGTAPAIEELHESMWSKIVARREIDLKDFETKRTDESKRVSQGKGVWRLLGY